MTPLDDVRLRMKSARTAWALHEWSALLREATSSIYAGRYQYAAATLMAHLNVETMPDLVSVFLSPTPQLKALVITLCTEEDIYLFPYALLGASCALRLRELLARAGTSDSV